MFSSIPHPYRQPFLGQLDRRFGNCLIGSSAAGMFLLLAVFLAPARIVEIASIEEIPERFARLILDKPKPRAPTQTAPAVKAITPAQEEIRPEAQADAPEKKAEQAGARHSKSLSEPALGKGQAGRERAQREVAGQLAEVTGSLSRVLADLSASLSSSDKGEGERSAENPKRRRIRSARSSDKAAAASAEVSAGAQTANVGSIRSSLTGSQIAIEPLYEVGSERARRKGGTEGVAGGQSGIGEFRSSASLLAVVRRYSAGIQFCYDNELKKNPGLGGKLVVGITVAASGEVLDVSLIEDALASPSLATCALGQIQRWKFPAIPKGEVVFKVPFLFTPPE